MPARLAPLHDVIVPEGSPARFVTFFSGSPVPSISWLREFQLIKPSKNFEVSIDLLKTLFFVLSKINFILQRCYKTTLHAL